ncbi:hypothetical protein [Spirosoma spitsbergense]|nr:hypothetical protein [Spirosoma spitsbergense]
MKFLLRFNVGKVLGDDYIAWTFQYAHKAYTLPGSFTATTVRKPAS